MTEHVLTQFEPGRIVGAPVGTAGEAVVWDAESLVLATSRRSCDALYRELREAPDVLAAEGIVGLYRIGDCLEPRQISDCIFDGHRLAREIDSEDPATPRPFIRENLVPVTADLRDPAMHAA